MKEPKNLREGLELHLQRGLPVMSYERNGYRTEALSKAGILDLLAAYPAEPAPVVAARDAYSDQMNLELRQSVAANVLEAMDVDQYLIDAVRNATPPPPALVPSEAFVVPLEDPNESNPHGKTSEEIERSNRWFRMAVALGKQDDYVAMLKTERECGQQPGIPMEKVRMVARALRNAAASGAFSDEVDRTNEAAAVAVETLLPNDPSADEWARLDAANADEDARRGVSKMLDAHYYDAGWSPVRQGFRCVCGWLGESHVQHVTDALIAAGLIKGTSGNGPMLSGEELRAASEKVDEWLDDPTPEQALRTHVADLLTDVDHFGSCGAMVEGDGTCTCLAGRLQRAIDAGQVSEPRQDGAA